MAKKEFARKGTEVDYIDRTITVEDEESDIRVKVNFNNSKATFKVSTSITTKQASLTNPDVTQAVIDQVANMLAQGVALALDKRKKCVEDPKSNQIVLSFKK